MDFYFAKAGKGNEDYEKYLGDGVKKKHLPIYFNGDFEVESELRSWAEESNRGDVINFLAAAELRKASRIVLMNNQKKQLFILEPTGKVLFKKINRNGSNEYHVKLMPVKILKVFDYKKLPLILLGMGANQYFIRGTFRRIDSDRYLGLYWALNKLIDGRVRNNKPSNLKLIGSVEFETLIAKIFEAKGFFVPARAGGNLPELDLLPKNLTGGNINIFGIDVKPGEVVSIQVKLTPSESGNADLNICVNSNGKENWIDEGGVESELKKFRSKGFDNPSNWLKQLLSWTE